MEFTEFSLLDLQLESNELIEFSNCQLNILGIVDSVKRETLKNVVLFVHNHFYFIKKQMVYEIYCEIPCIDNDKITLHEFIFSLELSSITIHENNDVEILIDSEEHFFGHYIVGFFSNNWKFKSTGYC